jgi:exopolysaccharide production protein ExoZ
VTALPFLGVRIVSPDRFLSVQYLRGLAALAVVIYHAELQLRRAGYVGWWPSPVLTGAGVDLFFVISGFIMWVTTVSRNTGPADFYARRVARIVPLYWFFTTVVVSVAVVVPQALQTTKFDLAHVVASYFFIPFPSPVDGKAFPILIPGWTLNYEMFFYFIFGSCLWIGSRLCRLAAVTSILIALALAGYAFQPQSTALAFWTNSIIIEFLFGLLLGWIVVAMPAHRSGGWALIASAVVTLGIAINIPDCPRFLAIGLPSALLVLGAVILERGGGMPKWSLPKLLGDASYSIYLSHVIFLSVFGQLWRKLEIGSGPASYLAFAVLSVILSAAVGILVYVLIEKPLGKLSVRKRRCALRPA